MLSVSRILCPVDFSETSRHALEQAVAVARGHGATVTVLNVFALAPVAETIPAGSPVVLEPARLSPSNRQELRRELRSFTSSVESAQVAMSLVVLDGDPVAAILAEAGRLPADLIVMGTHGRKGFNRLLLGSVSERVLREAPCPVLTVPPRAEDSIALGFARILCAVDFSGASGPALEYATALAVHENSELLALTVVEPLTRGGSGLREDVTTGVFDARAEFKRFAADRLVARIPQAARDMTRVRELVTIGAPAAEILHVADEEACDLIVLGVPKRTATDLLLFGSTAQQVLREARCPVLTVASVTVD